MDDDVINVSMYPSDHTPSTETGEVADQVMTRDGVGKPLNEQMQEDYACGDEPGHYFISSPVNILTLARDSSVVLYVEGGCANFTWASDNAWATFSEATTSVRYNTLTSAATEGQDTVVTVTDDNGLEVTINVPYNDASSCCEDVPLALAMQSTIGEVATVTWPNDMVIFIDGGCPPFSWEVTGSNWSVDNATTNSRRNRLHGAAGADVNDMLLTVEDACGATVSLGFAEFETVACCSIYEGQDLTLEVDNDLTTPIDWDFSGDHTGWTWDEEQTEDYDNVLTNEEDPTDTPVVVTGTDAGGAMAQKTVYSEDKAAIAGVSSNGAFVGYSDDSDIIVAVADNSSNNCEVYTFEVDSDGRISALLDTFESTSLKAAATELSITKAHTGVFVVGRTYDAGVFGSRGYVEAFVVAADGTISQHASPGVEVTTWSSPVPEVDVKATEVGSGIVLAVIGTSSGARLRSVAVSAAGAVTDPVLDSLTATGADGEDARVEMVTSTVAILVYTGASNRMYARLVTVNAGTGALATYGSETQIESTNYNTDYYDVVKMDTGWILAVGSSRSSAVYPVYWAMQISGSTIVKNTGYEQRWTTMGTGRKAKLDKVSTSKFIVGYYDRRFTDVNVTLGASISWTVYLHTYYGVAPTVTSLHFRDVLYLGGWVAILEPAHARTRRLC